LESSFACSSSLEHRTIGHTFMRTTKDAAAVFAIDSIECIGGGLARTQQRLVEAWAEIHLEELRRDWDLLQSGQPPIKIEPLK
jgi:hypothetical protein